MKHQVVIYNTFTKQWLHLFDARKVIETNNIDEVVPSLCMVEEMVTQQELFAAGFISYEASPAFDTALKVRKPSSFPLLWFGLYEHPNVIELSHTPSKTAHIPIHWTPSVNRAA